MQKRKLKIYSIHLIWNCNKLKTKNGYFIIEINFKG